MSICTFQYYEEQSTIVYQSILPNTPGLTRIVTDYTDDRPCLTDSKAIKEFILRAEPSLWIEHPIILDLMCDDFEAIYYKRLANSSTEIGQLFRRVLEADPLTNDTPLFGRLIDGFLHRMRKSTSNWTAVQIVKGQALALTVKRSYRANDILNLRIGKKVMTIETKDLPTYLDHETAIEVDKLILATTYLEILRAASTLIERGFLTYFLY